ncbi:MAG: 1-acyl-sn-glycerol-3-phosphate acyltransferase [Gammaproteobacteria bacterium]|nr:1-acyl-sn-glycerol-3-phosphate acyltransferase [Gammaproteobacteria bacterium]
MDDSITIPYWLFFLLIVFALIMVLDRILLPGMRWYLQRRVNRVIEEVNTRLDIEIRPFQLTRKQALIDQLIFDDKVVEAIRDYAQQHNMPKEVAQAKAIRYAEEIAPSFNAFIYFRLGYWIAKKVGRLLYRVRVGFYDDNQLKDIPDRSSVVFVMNHRSNMDYILVSFLVAEKTALSYAVGEWARIWPLQTLIKSMGAFFVRRNSRNALYRRVLERYVNLSTRAGVCQAVFLEGGLTKDGKIRQPRLGFMDYMLRDYHAEIDRDIVFVPVGINYDRVIEDKSLIRNLDPAASKRSTWFVIKTSLRFFFKTLLMKRQARWRRFGYASVNFGKPSSARDYCLQNRVDFSQLAQEQRFQHIEELAQSLMSDIKKVIPVLPVALMAEVLLVVKDHWKSELELKTMALQRIAALKQLGAPIDIASGAFEHVLTGALDMLVGRGFVDFRDGLYQPHVESIVILEYYANSIAHWQQQQADIG